MENAQSSIGPERGDESVFGGSLQRGEWFTKGWMVYDVADVLLFFQLQDIGSMVNCIDRFGRNAIRITVRDGPGFVQVDQGRRRPRKIGGHGAGVDIVRPLTGDRGSTYSTRDGVIRVKFKQIT